MQQKRIYISCNTLPNTVKSLQFLYQKIANSKLVKTKIILVHDSNFNLYNLNTYNLDVSYVLGLDNSYEYSCLHKMWKDSQTQHFYGLYLHCKGSSKTDEIEFENGIAWAEYMLIGLLDNVDICLHHLQKGADLVGSMWYRHFKGNFFWYNSKYIKKLWDPLHFFEHISWYERFIAEFWCAYAYWEGVNTKLPFPKIKNLFYLPLTSDKDFLKLKRENYIPDLQLIYICDNIEKTITENIDYRVFDKILLAEKDKEKYNDILFKFLNYDSEIVVL